MTNIFKWRGGGGDIHIVNNSFVAANASQGMTQMFNNKGMFASNYLAVKNDDGFYFENVGYGSAPNPIPSRLWDYNRYDTADGNVFKINNARWSVNDPTATYQLINLGIDGNSKMVTPGAPGLQVYEGTSITLSGGLL